MEIQPNYFKSRFARFEITVINEWKYPKRNPLNITIATMDLLYLYKFDIKNMFKIESSGFRIGMLGILFIFLFNEKKVLDQSTKEKIVEQLENIKKAAMKTPQPNAN